MKYAEKQFGVIAAFASLALLLLANAYATSHQFSLQTGQRGFLYTGDPGYLEPYTLATTQFGFQLQELARLSADDPAQVDNVTNLSKLSQEKLYELAETTALCRAGKVEDAPA